MAKNDMKKEKNYGAGKSRLPFDEDPEIGGTDDAKKANKGLQMNLFDADALESNIDTTPDYAAGSKKEYFNEKAYEYIEENEMNPTMDY